MYKDASNANRTKFNINGKQENYIYWIYLKDYGKKSASILSDYYQSQIGWMLSWSSSTNSQR